MSFCASQICVTILWSGVFFQFIYIWWCDMQYKKWVDSIRWRFNGYKRIHTNQICIIQRCCINYLRIIHRWVYFKALDLTSFATEGNCSERFNLRFVFTLWVVFLDTLLAITWQLSHIYFAIISCISLYHVLVSHLMNQHKKNSFVTIVQMDLHVYCISREAR